MEIVFINVIKVVLSMTLLANILAYVYGRVLVKDCNGHILDAISIMEQNIDLMTILENSMSITKDFDDKGIYNRQKESHDTLKVNTVKLADVANNLTNSRNGLIKRLKNVTLLTVVNLILVVILFM